MESRVVKSLEEVLPGVDADTLEYFKSIILDNTETIDLASLTELLAPFVESYGFADCLESANRKCEELFNRLENVGSLHRSSKGRSDEPKLLEKIVVMSEKTQKSFSNTEQAAIDSLWGFSAIRGKKNDTIESIGVASGRSERKALKEQKKWLDDLDHQFAEEEAEEEDDDLQVSNMTLPDFSGGSREKDIQVNNVTIMFGGQILLEGADLRFVYGRRYGLVGRNGVGKTTLLRHIANFEIEGFPRHHRVLHVKQEVKSSEKSVLQVVLDSDVERITLLERQKRILEQIQSCGEGEAGLLPKLLEESEQLTGRLQQIGADTAESRAAAILAGLQFTEAMQTASTSSLSGGWLMRVALASALLIEPDLLMLDEPTNHLDLEAVLWLQNYLLTYPHTVLLVSHDRTFLNEVCTDVILFKNQKLTYYRGNYDIFEGTRKEMLMVQQRQHDAQQAKLQHMQEFVDRFRYNANRAALVQSRIKAINRETVIEAPEDEEKEGFEFAFSDAGQLGNNVIRISRVSFGYPNCPVLFQDVDLSMEQSSRIALVGPNGAGKSTLLNLIQGKLQPTAGTMFVNPQLRIAVFTQHHLDSFDLRKSPLQNMMDRWPLSKEAELRAHLGRYEIEGTDMLKPMKFSSGGQKSRVAFACLTYAKPHIVLMDEPTNHLDMGAIEALIVALKNFTGGVMVISHDQYFITSVCNEIWVVGGKSIRQYRGEFEDYKRETIAAISKKSKASK